MNLTKLALKRPVSCFLVLLALAVFGISSIFGFKMELTPDIEMPMLIVMATYPGADPESVDELVASVIEDSGSTLSGVDSVNSYSFENYCMVLFTYEYGVDIDECHNDLRAAMETAKLSLPDDVDQPTIIEMNMNSMDVMTISAVEVGDVDLLKVVNESVVPELESLSSVAQVSVTGGSEDYIKVELNETLMKQYGLTMSSVAQMMGTVDFTYPAGSVTQGSQDLSVATSMEYNTVQKLREVPLMTTKGQVITLQDIANVTTASKDASSISRYNGQDNVSIGIKNKSSAGTVNACRDVKEKLQQIQAENPAIEFEVTYDASSSIISALTSVAETLLLGVVLTMAVLFLFFGDFKASLIVGASMPISLFLTLILMSMMGFSMNIVTLGSLVIAIGMMVDSSIVVIESSFRRQKSTPDLKQAALEGTKEVTASIIASTITTIVVYLPLATMKGLSGQMFEQLGFTIVFAMLASLIAAMMLVPLFYTVFKPKEKENLPIDKLLKKFTTRYRYEFLDCFLVQLGILVIRLDPLMDRISVYDNLIAVPVIGDLCADPFIHGITGFYQRCILCRYFGSFITALLLQIYRGISLHDCCGYYFFYQVVVQLYSHGLRNDFIILVLLGIFTDISIFRCNHIFVLQCRHLCQLFLQFVCIIGHTLNYIMILRTPQHLNPQEFILSVQKLLCRIQSIHPVHSDLRCCDRTDLFLHTVLISTQNL